MRHKVKCGVAGVHLTHDSFSTKGPLFLMCDEFTSRTIERAFLGCDGVQESLDL